MARRAETRPFSPRPGPARDAYDEAMEAAGRWLAAAPKTERELRERLDETGFAPEVVDRAVTRLADLGLVDDGAFARAWVAGRRRPLGTAALIGMLEARGVDRNVAEAAVAAAASDETERAADAAARALPRVSAYPLREQSRRLWVMLARRGFSEEASAAALRRVLPPEGWD